MRVLLTGSSGWLGRFLTPRLRAAGHVVIGIDVAPGADTHVIGSVANRTVVERAFSDQGVEAIITRVYDASEAQRVLGFRCKTDFGRVLDALRPGRVSAAVILTQVAD